MKRYPNLRHQVQINQASTTQDASGQPLQTWTTIRTTSAEILLAGQHEAFSAGQFTSQVTHVITVRWSPVNVQPGMRAVFGSRTFRLQGVINEDLRNEWVFLYVLELNAQSVT